ncbi:MAG: hypothetical protein JXA67_21735 [Micromonosporaceae bacterium]|nr:hypothetical protein [Micromonosporaceae bacterium]
MSDTATAARRFGEGPLSRASTLIYNLMVIEALLLLTIAPGGVVLLLLASDASNLPLMAVCLLPLGPAGSASVYALHRRSQDLTDLRPAASFWRGYRANARGVLWIWIPALLWLTILGMNLANLRAAGVPGWWTPMLIAIAIVVALWTINALVITSLFAFRARDIARLAVYFLVRTPVVTLGNAGVLIIAVGVAVVFSEVVSVLLGSVLMLMLVRTCGPMIDHVTREFTA